MDILKNLNINQKLAVMHGKGPQLILGGAGTGKTLVIACRTAYLMRERDVLPSNILVITSTNMAAERMSKQVQKLLDDDKIPLITTFQTLCLNILRRDIQYLGFQSNFGIYDDEDSMLLLKDIIVEMNLDEEKFTPKAVGAKIDDYKNHGMFPKDIDSVATDDIYNRMIVQIYAAYQERLKKSNVLDFGDITLQTIRLLNRFPDVLNYNQVRYQWIMVDNYEDIHPMQYDLIQLLTGERKNLCVFADDNKTIFSFWPSSSNVLEFEKVIPECAVVRLQQNYRSTATILKAASEVIKHNFGNKGKTFWTENPTGDKIRYVRVETNLVEARFVCREIGRLCSHGAPLDEIAIFYRTNAQSRLVEEALVGDALPYHIVGGARFYSCMEVKDILAYLRVLDNPADNVSLKRIINVPPRGIGKIIVDEVFWFAFRQGISFYEALQSHLLDDRPRARLKLTIFTTMIERFRELASSISLIKLVSTIVTESGYLAHLKESLTEDNAERLENLEQLFATIEEFCERKPGAGLSEFLEQVSQGSDLEQGESRKPSVSLVNLHAAKGLEFKVVFMIGLEERLFPNVRTLDDLEVERILCYIGMTRAREWLYLLNARRILQFDERQCVYQCDQEQKNLPSRFLKDIPPELMSVEDVLETEEAPYYSPSAFVSDSDETIKDTPVMPEPNIYPCPECNILNRLPIERDPTMGKCGSCHSPLIQDLPPTDSDIFQNEYHKGSRLNYLYFRRSIKSPFEVISELTDEQLYFRAHGKSVTEDNSAVAEVRRIRQCVRNDNMLLLQCLDGKALTSSEIDEKRKEGFVSNAELRLFQMLKALSDTNWSIYHQVDVGGLLNPIDIAAVTADFQIYAIELDGPHHLLSSQRINDDRRDALLLNQGFNVIRVGYEKYALSCSQAAQEILLVLRGQVKPENTWRPDVRVNIDGSNGATDSKHPDFYRNRPQTDPSSDCEQSLGLPRRYCYIYCQSTGINEKSQIVDFCLLVEEGEVRKQYYSKIKPNCPIESKATTLHGISADDVNDCPSLYNYLEQHELKKILEDSDSLIVAYDWNFMGRIIKNSAIRYLNWQNMNLYSIVDTVRLKHGLKPISTISEAVASLGLSPDKYKRYDSKAYARLVHAMYFVTTNRGKIGGT